MPAKKKDQPKAKIVKSETMTPKEKAERIQEIAKLRKGRVFLYTSKGKLHRIEKTEKKRSSKQIKEDKSYWKEKGLMAPPYDPEVFLTYYESCIYFMRTVDQIAQDVAGQGYKLEPQEDVDVEKDPKAKEFKEKAEALLDNPNDDYDLIEMIKRLIIDWGSIGWLNIELVPNEGGDVGSMYHVPAYTIRVHESNKKYCQTRYVKGQRKRMWFKKFGEEKILTAKDGEEATKGTEAEDLANWMIMDVNYYPRSDFYGTPNILGAIGSLLSLIGIRDFNLSFFENFGVPAALVVLYGDWDEGSDTELTDFLETEIRGSENAYKSLVLQAPEPKETATGQEKKGIEWIPLMAEVKEGSFMKDYYIHMRNENLVAYSMPPYRIGIAEQGSLGGSTAEESTKIYMESIVEALQQKVENIFNFRILPTLLEKTKEGETPKVPLLLKLIAPDIRNKDAEVARAIKLFRHASLTVDELRAVDGRDAFGEKEGGDERYIEKGLRKYGEEEYEKTEEEILRMTQDLEGRVRNLEEDKK
jgi:capsid portal protein